MIYRTSNNEIEKYRESQAINQSSLKKIADGITEYMNDEELSGSNITLGSAIDCILTEGVDAFKEQYYISELENLPTEKEMIVANKVFEYARNNGETLEGKSIHDFTEFVQMATEEVEYYPNWKPETRVKKIVENTEQYFNSLIASEGKTTLSTELAIKIQDLVERVQTSNFYYETISPEGTEDSTTEHLYFQLPIFFTYKGMECKALLDAVRVSMRDNNTVFVYPMDIKTTSSTIAKFPWSFKKYRYDIQAVFYTEALEQWVKEQFPNKDCIIMPFSFIVISTTTDAKPVLITMTEDYMQYALKGTSYLIKTANPKWIIHNEMCLEEMMNKLKKHIEYQNFTDEINAFLNNYSLTIDYDTRRF